MCTRVTPLLNEPSSNLAEKWTELEWQAMWYSGAFGTTFRTVSGSLVEIIQFGFWNREPGPDFVHASLRIDGEQLLEGDIELDMHVADWDRHGHSQNPAFDRVVLHLFLHKGGASYFTRTTLNREVVQIHLQSEIELLHINPPIAHPGRCCAPLGELPGRTIDSLIETAARVRMQRKADQFHRAALAHGMDEALFQAFAVALGYKLNKIPFLVLAQRAKLQLLRDHGPAAESLLFGVAGFLEDRKINRTASIDPDYWRHLWEHWWQLRSQFGQFILRQNLWRFGMTRPSNHPHRRLGALADWESYQKIRAELSNRRLAIVGKRLFGESARAREHLRFLYQQQNPFVFALALDVLRLLDQHPDLDIAQVDAKGLVPTASQLDEFAQLGGRTELCHVE